MEDVRSLLYSGFFFHLTQSLTTLEIHDQAVPLLLKVYSKCISLHVRYDFQVEPSEVEAEEIRCIFAVIPRLVFFSFEGKFDPTAIFEFEKRTDLKHLEQVLFFKSSIMDLGPFVECKSLTRLRLNEVVFGASEGKIIANVFANNQNLVKLALNGAQLQQDSLDSIMDELESHTRLLCLFLGENGIGLKEMKKLAPILSRMTQLKALRLDGNSFEDEGAIMLAGALRKLKLNTLDLDCCEFGGTGMKEIFGSIAEKNELIHLQMSENVIEEDFDQEEIAASLAMLTKLRLLELSGCGVDERCIKSVKRLTRLKHFWVNLNHIQEKEDVFADSIRNLNLERLVVQDAGISLGGINTISEALEGHVDLNYFSVDGNSFGDQGMKSINENLRKLSRIEMLGLGDCDISEADELVEFMQRNVDLKEIYLRNNPFEADSFYKICECFAKLCKLESLVLSECKFGDEGAKQLSRTLRVLPNFRELHIDNNAIKGEGMVEICRALQDTRLIKFMTISTNLLDKEAFKALEDLQLACPDLIFMTEDEEEDSEDEDSEEEE